MLVTITTDGGFTGRGLGNTSIESSGDADVQRALDACEPDSWHDEYASSGADLVRYTLSAGSRIVTWSDGAEIPGDLRELFDVVWGKRSLHLGIVSRHRPG